MIKQILTTMLLLIALPVVAQDLQVSGVVTSAENGEPLISVIIKVKEEPSRLVLTDYDGNYTIKVKQGQTLVFSYVGYEVAEKVATQSGDLSVAMTPQSFMLEEVVAIGYGTMKKSDLTGSVSTVASEQLQKTPSPSLANALQGQAAGVTVNSLTGRPGSSAEVRIRGVGTVNGASPIYVIDGVITDDISFLSPSDIEHTEILKDASATAIYGSRGANGVIIVTTKTGKKSDRATVTFDAYVGVQQRHRKLDVMNAQEFADAYVAINGTTSSKKIYSEQGFNKWLSLFMGVGSSAYYPTVYDADSNPTGFDYSQVDTDWQDVVFQDGMIQNYHLSLDGGGDKYTYSMSGSWFKQEGIIIGSDYQRFTARMNTSFKPFSWLKMGENISFMASVAQNAYESGDNSESSGANILSAAFAMAPWDPERYPEGTVNKNGEDMSGKISAGSNYKNVTNPLSMVEYNHPKTRIERWVGNVFAELTPIEHLTFRSSFSFDYYHTDERNFAEAYEVSAYDSREESFISRSMARTYNWNVDNILTYARTIGDHDFSAMVGQTVEQYDYYQISGSGSELLFTDENHWYISQATEYGNPGDAVSRSRRFSWLGRLYYSYKNRYLATVNFRADGSSKFPENAWGYFPSFSLAWRLSEENFLRDATFLSDLKLRFGWGRVGNDNIGDDAFTLTMTSGPTFAGYTFGKTQTLYEGSAVLTWINQGGKWETTEQWNVGIDFGLWNSKVTGTVEGFIRNTYDMLMSVTAPAQVGNRYAGTANVGKVRNRGIEITLTHRNQVTRDFSYSISGNVSFIDNELTSLNGGSTIYSNYDNVQVVDEGYPLYYFWGYIYDGIYQTDEEVLEYLTGYTSSDTPFHAGDAKYRDVNGDGVIDDDDRVDLGSSIPWLNYGLNLGFYWKDFDVQLFFQGVAGNKIYNQMRHRLESDGSTSVISPIMANAWTSDNTDGTIPNPNNSVNYYVSSRFLESGSYMRLKNVQIGYSLPKKWMAKAGMQRCRFYVQGSNLFTITDYTGFDPEVNGGVDYGNYPQARTYIVGVNITY